MILLELLQLLEAKSVRDYRHSDISKEFKYWGTKEYGYINPRDGFHFLWSKGDMILFSTNNEHYSKVVALDKWQDVKSGEIEAASVKDGGRDLWNQLGGLVDFKAKTITISKEDVGNSKRMRVIYHIKEFQQALRNLKKYGIDDNFKIKGTAAPLNSLSVKEILALESNIDKILNDPHPVLYHGTSLSRYTKIEKEGLKPGKTDDVYVDLIKGYSEHNIYLATDVKTAEFYGKRQAKKDGDTEYVVLKIKIPDTAKFLPDDAFAYNFKPENWRGGVVGGLKTNGSVAYKGPIRPAFIEMAAKRKA